MSNNLIRLLALVILGLVAIFISTRVANGTSQILKSNPVNNAPMWLDWGKRVSLYLSRDKALPEGNSTPNKANPEFEAWLDELGDKENCPTTGLLDRNNKKSYGRYCFQRDTFLEALKKYREEYNLLPYSEEDELLNWLSDESFQRELVKIIIREETNLVGGEPRYSYHWYTSIHKRGLGLAPVSLTE